jgi:hypothetical protein
MRTPPLTVVATPATSPQPPATLGDCGRSLWHRITSEYDFTDASGQEMLSQICHASDRADNLRQLIDHDGEMIPSRTGPREHPALKHELTNRSFVVRGLHRLGLDYEPLRSLPGRPPKR